MVLGSATFVDDGGTLRWSSVQVVRMHPDEAAISSTPRNYPANVRRCSADRHDRLSRAFDDCPGALDGSQDEILSTRLPGMRPGGIAKARGSPPIARLIIVCSHLKFTTYRPWEKLRKISLVSPRVRHEELRRGPGIADPGGVFAWITMPGCPPNMAGAAVSWVAPGGARHRPYSPLK